MSGIYSRGAVLSTRTGEFETSQASAQVQYGFGRCCGLFGSYGLYNHRLNGLELVPASFAERYTRQIGRVGLTFWLPLYGAF